MITLCTYGVRKSPKRANTCFKESNKIHELAMETTFKAYLKCNN